MDLRVVRMSKVRSFPNPEDGLRSLVDRAPQAEAFAEQTMERMRPSLAWVYVFRRRFATSAVLLVTAWLFVHVVFGANGTAAYTQKKTEYQDLQKDVDALQKENDQYAQHIKALQSDPKMIEKEAREQLHYTKPGEVVFVAPPDPQPSAPPATHAASK